MKIAVLGAGFTGLTAAYELQKRGHEVWVFEKEGKAGGAAGGFRRPGWDWYLDFAYHHWFTNDHNIFSLCREIGWDKILVKRPETATLYKSSKDKTTAYNQYNLLFKQLFGESVEIYKLDSAIDLLKFERLSFFNRLRTGVVLAALKYGPKLSIYDNLTSERFLKTTMGLKSFKTLWEPLFSKKFAGHKSRINTAFFWARIKKRTPSLAYPEGGYQALANYFSSFLSKKGVKIHYQTEIKAIEVKNSKYHLSKYSFDTLVNTLPSPIFLKLEKGILPQNYRKRLAKIQYLGAQTIIFETAEPVLPRTYWLNIADMTNPWMLAVQHTNFINRKHFNNHHLLYLATYTNNPRKNEFFESPAVVWQKQVFIPYAQPLYTIKFSQVMPDYQTPVSNLFFANMELTYPYDRGTNYAVKVGKEVAKRIR